MASLALVEVHGRIEFEVVPSLLTKESDPEDEPPRLSGIVGI